MDADALRQGGAVLLVLALLGVALWVFRRAGWYRPGMKGPSMGGNRRARCLEAVERMALTPQHSVHLIEAQGHRLLIAVHPQGCTLLAQWAGEGTPASEASHARTNNEAGGAAA